MGINTQVIKLKEAIARDINESGLPPTVIDMVIGEFKIQLQALSEQAIEAEQKAQEKEGEIEDGKEIHKSTVSE